MSFYDLSWERRRAIRDAIEKAGGVWSSGNPDGSFAVLVGRGRWTDMKLAMRELGYEVGKGTWDFFSAPICGDRYPDHLTHDDTHYGSGLKHCNTLTAVFYPAAEEDGAEPGLVGPARRADLRADFGGAEPGADGKPQLLLADVAPIGDRQRLDHLAKRELAGGNAPPPAGGLFDLDSRAQLDLLDKP